MTEIPEITLSTKNDDPLGLHLEQKLLADLRQESEQAVNQRFALSVTTEAEQLIAGLTASTSYGWLLIKILWVEKSYRQAGLGRKLMSRAEEQARMLGCHSAWLDTSSQQAMQFYKELGYSVFGELENPEHQLPPDHHRWFMRKSLLDEQST